MVQFTFRMIEADQVSMLLLDDAGELALRLSRTREGATGHDVPLGLARTALREKVALLSDNDAAGSANGAENVRSSVCAPLIGSEGRALGVLYVDSLASSHRVDDEDLEFLVAFAGIGAVAIDNIRFAERSRHEALVRSNFERFFNPHLAARIAASPEKLRLGGERRRVAVLFCDIRGFTPLAAHLTPDETARLLTEFFSEMSECVFRHGGTLDKFIGDAVMAQWGAPISEPDDADRALDAALDMMAATERLTARWRAQGRPGIEVGIGLNYGDAFAGYLGSERRLEYTIIGDTVNTASHMCATAEPGEILVTTSLRDALVRPHSLVAHAPLLLAGRATPFTVLRAAR
jgi:adenylate cyclase